MLGLTCTCAEFVRLRCPLWIHCAEGWSYIETYGDSKADWLRQYRPFAKAVSQLRVAWGAPAPHANNMEYPLPVHSAPASCANPSNSSDSASLTRGPAPSTRGVRHSPLDRVKVVLVFQSTRPRGARRQTMLFVLKRFRFQSTRPRGARLDAVLRLSDQFKFQSTRPRGARPVNDNVILAFELFQSTRPRGARLRSPA